MYIQIQSDLLGSKSDVLFKFSQIKGLSRQDSDLGNHVIVTLHVDGIGSLSTYLSKEDTDALFDLYRAENKNVYPEEGTLYLPPLDSARD